MSDAQAKYYSANSAQLSVNNDDAATDVEDIEVIDDTTVPQTIITRVDGKGVPPRRITWPATATPSVLGDAATSTSKSPGPTTEEVLEATDISIPNPVDATTTTKSRRKPPGQTRVVPTPASPPSIPHPSGSRAYARIAELDAVFQSILSMEDNSEDDDLLDLVELRLKNNRRRCRQARRPRPTR